MWRGPATLACRGTAHGGYFGARQSRGEGPCPRTPLQDAVPGTPRSLPVAPGSRSWAKFRFGCRGPRDEWSPGEGCAPFADGGHPQRQAKAMVSHPRTVSNSFAPRQAYARRCAPAPGTLSPVDPDALKHDSARPAIAAHARLRGRCAPWWVCIPSRQRVLGPRER
jgi:hypothetical protein